MMINSFNSYSAFTYANISTSTSKNIDSQNMPPKGEGRPEGGHGPGGPKGGRPPGPRPQGGPNLDTDDDGNWSKTELEEYASYSAEKLGVSLDVDEIISKYDGDGDGKINSDERDALGKDNGLQLPSHKKMMEHMMPRPKSNSEDNDNNYNVEKVNKNAISKCISAYTASKNYNNENLITLLNITG